MLTSFASLVVGGCAMFESLIWWNPSAVEEPPARPAVVFRWQDIHRDSLLSDYDFASYPKMRSPWVDSIFATLSLREKIAQMVVPFTFSDVRGRKLNELLSHVSEQGVGGVIISKGSVENAAWLIDTMQSLAKLPLLISADFENGLSMRLTGATEFPSMMAVGATGNPDYAYALGRAIAMESRALGVHQNYGPVADVNSNPKNPIINLRSFGENPQQVSLMAESYIRGTQDGRVIATAKHFPGHGDSEIDSHSDMPVIRKSQSQLDSVELYPFRRLIASGVLSVMTAHLAVPGIESDSTLPATLSRTILDSLLREEYGFKGLLVTDAMNMRGLLKRYANGTAAKLAVRAGVDILLMPNSIGETIDTLLAAVKRGEVSEEEIDRSVRRILSYKEWLGLSEDRFSSAWARDRVIGAEAHRELATRIAHNAVTLVRNDSMWLPLPRTFPGKASVLSLTQNSDTADAMSFFRSIASGFSNLTHGTVPRSMPLKERKALLDSLAGSDLVIVASYVNVRTGSGTIALSTDQRTLMKQLGTIGKRTIIIAFGSPYVLTDVSWAGAMLCAYGSDTPTRSAVASVLFGETNPTGKLPVTIPEIAPIGTGHSYPSSPSPADTSPSPEIPFAHFTLVDSLIERQILSRAFPGAQLIVYHKGRVVHAKAYGHLTYDSAVTRVTEETLYDIASLTKVVATTSAVMKLYEEGKLRLEDRVASFLPVFGANGKERVTIRNLLLHNSGLPAFQLLYRTHATPEDALNAIYSSQLEYATEGRTVYSDFGMIVLGKVVETITGMTLDAYVTREIFQPLRMMRTLFRPPDSLRDWIAPTEFDDYWRKRLVHGTVHDETAALLGGVAGHAGLFSCAGDLARFAHMMLNGGELDGVRLFKQSTVRLFTKRTSNGRALGWDVRSSTGSSAGRYFSQQAFGHTGFTGTSIWIDPDADMFVVFLTNRVHPTRENRKLVAFRAVLHDAIRECIAGMADDAH